MFEKLSEIDTKPKVFSRYTADSLWTDEHRAKQMLAFHLNADVDVSSRRADAIERSSAWMVDHFKLRPDKSVCDFGCGPGLYTSRLARSGASVTGLDFSESSIRYAKRQAEASRQAINYINANYLECELKEQFDLITLIMCDFCALSPAQRKVLLQKFHRSLKDDGAILLDVYSVAAYAEREEAVSFEKNQLNQFWSPDDYYCFLHTYKYDEELVVLDKYTIFPESGGEETVYNWLQYFDPDSLSAELSEAGFAVTELYGDVSGAPYSEQNAEFAVVAKKKKPSGAGVWTES
ncbi:MAG: class I SAM-dependent methyltransferase [Pseudomonadota bacterium]